MADFYSPLYGRETGYKLIDFCGGALEFQRGNDGLSGKDHSFLFGQPAGGVVRFD